MCHGFFKQLTIASVTTSFYAMTFVAFVGLCASLALCCDPIYWSEVPFRTKPVLAHVTNVPQESSARLGSARIQLELEVFQHGSAQLVSI